MKTELSLWCIFTILLHVNSAFKLNQVKLVQPHIINGEPASLGQFPWQVVIYFTDVFGAWICGGTIINEEWVLTAAHCGARFISCTVYAGLVDLRNLDNSTSRNAWNMQIHQGYDDQTLAHDIGLLQLEEPLIFNDYIKSADLASEPLESNTDILISGWGLVSDNSSRSDILNYGTLTIIDNLNCNAIYGDDTIFEEMVCAVAHGNVTQATCFGDTGGPAIVYNKDIPVIVAVSSFISDRGCESGDPSGFTRIAYYKEWIETIIGI